MPAHMPKSRPYLGSPAPFSKRKIRAARRNRNENIAMTGLPGGTAWRHGFSTGGSLCQLSATWPFPADEDHRDFATARNRRSGTPARVPPARADRCGGAANRPSGEPPDPYKQRAASRASSPSEARSSARPAAADRHPAAPRAHSRTARATPDTAASPWWLGHDGIILFTHPVLPFRPIA